MKNYIAIASSLMLVSFGSYQSPVETKPKIEPPIQNDVELNRIERINVCPVVGASGQNSGGYVPDATEGVAEYIHCTKCQQGVLRPSNEDNTVGECSFCSELFKGIF